MACTSISRERAKDGCVKLDDGPEVGDLVVAKYDEERSITCYGTVMERRVTDCLVVWWSATSPMGYWDMRDLRVITEGERDD